MHGPPSTVVSYFSSKVLILHINFRKACIFKKNSERVFFCGRADGTRAESERWRARSSFGFGNVARWWARLETPVFVFFFLLKACHKKYQCFGVFLFWQARVSSAKVFRGVGAQLLPKIVPTSLFFMSVLSGSAWAGDAGVSFPAAALRRCLYWKRKLLIP